MTEEFNDNEFVGHMTSNFFSPFKICIFLYILTLSRFLTLGIQKKASSVYFSATLRYLQHLSDRVFEAEWLNPFEFTLTRLAPIPLF